MKKLAIVASHPVQYNAPWFALLAQSGEIQLKVFYTWEQSAQGAKYDPDFKRTIEWDIPLLEGYEYTFVKNTSQAPGSHHFKGLINPTLNAEIETWAPDAILVIGWSFDSHLKCLRRFHGRVPVLFRGDSTLLDDGPGLKKQLRYLFLRWVYSHVNYALTVGTNNRSYYLKCGMKEAQLVLAPHAIDNRRFAEPEERYDAEAAIWRQSLGIGADDLVLQFAGKLESKKNPFFLIDLARQISDPRLKIIFTGNGALESELRAAAAGDSRILFLDFQNQQTMPVLYRLGDVYILPSRGPGETWGLGGNEAMASGCAVMMSDKAGGAVDLIANGVNGLVFSIDHPAICIDFVRGLLDDGKLLASMKQASRQRIASFSFENIVASIRAILFAADLP